MSYVSAQGSSRIDFELVLALRSKVPNVAWGFKGEHKFRWGDFFSADFVLLSCESGYSLNFKWFVQFQDPSRNSSFKRPILRLNSLRVKDRPEKTRSDSNFECGLQENDLV